jgi:uncharacterized protein
VILPDVNVLAYAHRREAEDHDAYAAWLTTLVAGQDELAPVDHCLAGFLRIVTNPRIFADPAATAPGRVAQRIYQLYYGYTLQ